MKMQPVEPCHADRTDDTASVPDPAWVEPVHDRAGSQGTKALGDDPIKALSGYVTRSHVERREQGGQGLAGGNDQHLTECDQNHREDK